MNGKELTPPMRPSQQAFEQQIRYDSATQTFTAHCAVCGRAKKQRETWLRDRGKTLLNLRRELLFCDSCGKWICEDCFLIDDGKGNGIGICTACALAQGISGLTSAQFEEAWLDIQRPIQKRLEAARRAAKKSIKSSHERNRGVYMNCTKCGKEVAETVKLCDGCRTPLGSEQENIQGTVQSTLPNQEIKENKWIFMLSYVLFFLPLISCPTSKIGRFHANQGLVLLITSVAGNIAVSILSSLLTWRLWAITSFIGWAWGIVVLALIIIGMVNANKGEQKPLPAIGGFTIIK